MANTMKKIIVGVLSGSLLTLSSASVIFAQPSPLQNNFCIDTAIGCIDITSESGFAGFFLKWAIGLGGGIAFLLVVYSGFMILTSKGSPERLKAGQELLSSAIMGLILLIFSVFILRIIGVDILQIQGL
jgi:hypothetical protein